MTSGDHAGGFSLDTSVRVEGADRQGLEWLLRYCTRPAFALERLCEITAEHLVYQSVKPAPGGNVSLMLTPFKLTEAGPRKFTPGWPTGSMGLRMVTPHH